MDDLEKDTLIKKIIELVVGDPYEVEVRDEKAASAGGSSTIDNLVAAADMQCANGSIGESTGDEVDGYTEEKL